MFNVTDNNKVKIEGILSETNLSYNSYTNKAGQVQDSITGMIKVRVEQSINGEDVELEVPVYVLQISLLRQALPILLMSLLRRL